MKKKPSVFPSPVFNIRFLQYLGYGLTSLCLSSCSQQHSVVQVPGNEHGPVVPPNQITRIGKSQSPIQSANTHALEQDLEWTGIIQPESEQLPELHHTIQKQISPFAFRVFSSPEGLRLVTTTDNVFNTSGKIKQNYQAIFSTLSNLLTKVPQTHLEIQVFSDNMTDTLNSRQKAEELVQRVQNLLVAKGVSPQRIVNNGRGKERSTASNKTALGRARNRRLEIWIR